MFQSKIQSLIRTWKLAPKATPPPFDKTSARLSGWPPSAEPVPLVDMMTDDQLEEINRMLDFNCFTVDSRGRRFGLPAGPKKRSGPQELPDRRVVLLDEEVGLRDKSVLEVGCFEGVHTIALAKRARAVTALDGRVENVVRTIVRASFYGQHPKVIAYDMEQMSGGAPEWMKADVAFHAGVLYHLTDPVQHLRVLLEGISHAILLDTHVARDEQVNASYFSGDTEYRYHRIREGGRYKGVFAGMSDHAKWLTEGDLHGVLTQCGFGDIKSIETRNENNGKRVLLIAKRRKS